MENFFKVIVKLLKWLLTIYHCLFNNNLTKLLNLIFLHFNNPYNLFKIIRGRKSPNHGKIIFINF